MQNVSLNSENPLLQLTRAGGTIVGPVLGSDWTIFTLEDPTYIPVEWAYPSFTHYSEDRQNTVILVSGRVRIHSICRLMV